jgi:hypothetical protein
MKAFALRDWNLFNARYGSGFLDAQTSSQEGTNEWNTAMQALQTLSNDGAVLHNESVNFKFLEQSARNSLPFEPMVQWCNSLYAKCYRGIDLATGVRHHQNGQGNSPSHPPVGASIQKEESGIFLGRDAKWVTGVFNERIDRPMIRYLFGQEPRAWFVLMPPPGDYRAEDLTALQTLVPLGLRVALKDVYQRFRWRVPAHDDPCLTPPLGAETPEAPNSNLQAPEKLQTPSPKVEQASSLSPGKPAETADGPIASGAEPGAFQTASPALPDPQVDAAAFWSRAALAPRGADGQTLPMPSLGYTLPNEELQQLQITGLGNTRAAQAIREQLPQRRETSVPSVPSVPSVSCVPSVPLSPRETRE